MHPNSNHRFLRAPVEARVLAKIRPSADCWLWVGARLKTGYGVLWVQGRNVLAHRLMYSLFVGPIPEGLSVCHRCDVPACVRPEHLFLGTPADNTHDMMAKGRAVFGGPPGERSGAAKLTDGDVRDIRRRVLDPGVTRAQLAREYGLSFTSLDAVVQRKTWRHVP